MSTTPNEAPTTISTPSPAAGTEDTTESVTVEQLQRIILPRPGEPRDVRSLYLLEGDTGRRAHASSRTSVTIAADTEVSFETYFNGFAASYWRRWTTLTEVALRVEVSGSGRIDLYRSKIDGSRIAITGAAFGAAAADADPLATAGVTVAPGSEGRDIVEIVVPLDRFEDGGWVWFDLTADDTVELHRAGWFSTVAAPETRPDPRPGHEGQEIPNDRSVVIGIPTFNRPDDAIAALTALASDPEVDEVIEAVLMPDQSSPDKKLPHHPGFAGAVAPFGGPTGGRFHRFEQGNLGGSGGYSRIMYEVLAEDNNLRSPFILYMDDDISIEPDAILRIVSFARFSRHPMLVGGQMLNLQERSHLHTMGEVIDRHSFMWTAAPNATYDHDFARYPLRDRDNAASLHRRIDVDYNGWWMCLIPRVVAEQIGQPLPLFIKWDDGEFGLRAGRAGYPTVSLPGVAIWHMAWSDKDDAIDWQAYFHLRNRLVVAALQHEGPTTGLVRSMLKATVKHLVCQEYSTVAIQQEAIRDFLAGPEGLFDLLPTALGKVNAMRRDYPDAVVLPSAADLPAPSGAPASITTIPVNPVSKVATLAKGLVHSLRKEDRRHHDVPQANFPPIDARWFSLSRLDGATVTTADGRGVVYRKRDRDKALALLRETLALHKELRERFDALRTRYRDAHPRLTSREAWSSVFAD